MKSLILGYAGENGVVGNGEDKKEKPHVTYGEWCRKPNSTQEVVQLDN